MRRSLIFAALMGFVLRAAGPTDRAPVLVELFTSEGCSSCPPADRLLQQLDSRAIVLEEHVDYWDHDGWKDPHSSHEITLRQEDYANRLSKQGPYTPEMVVDGVVEFNGSDGRRAAAEIAKLADKPKAKIQLARQASGLQVNIQDAPASASVILVTAENTAASDVRAGENKGLHMEHVAVVLSLRKLGNVKRGAGFNETVSLPADAARKRLVVFLQTGGTGAVVGAAESGPS